MSEEDQVTETPEVPEWMGGLQSDELKSSDSLKQFKDLDGLAKGFADLKAYQGQSLRIPGEDAGDEQRQEFYQKVIDQAPGLMFKPDFNDPELSSQFYRSLGVPEAADKYQAPEVEAIKVEEDRLNALKEIAHKNHLTDKQFKGFMEEALKLDASANASAQEAAQASMEELKQEWGYAFNDQIAVAEKVRSAFFDFIPPEAMDGPLAKSLAAVGKHLGNENVNLSNQGKNQQVTNTPDMAREQINEINMNPEHPYWVAGHPDHQAAIQKMLKLMKEANPSEAA